jgi:broad specificity phosphatase PhoE
MAEPTRFWLLRHALVEQNARLFLYGTMDVLLCPEQRVAEDWLYRAIAARLPRPATWAVTPLQRTRQTAEALFAAGYPRQTPHVVPALIEQDLGDWQGLPHAELPARLANPAHPFWPLAGDERPPGGESMQDVIARVGPAMEHLARANAGGDVVIVAHGGAIRAAVAHAMGVAADPVLHLAVQNLSLTRLERHDTAWRVVGLNELPDPAADP